MMSINPDSIDAHPSGGRYERPMDEGGGETSTFPFEIWHYRYIEGISKNIDLEFVDTCQCGDYHFTIDRGEKERFARAWRGSDAIRGDEPPEKTNRFKGGGLGSHSGCLVGAASQGKRV